MILTKLKNVLCILKITRHSGKDSHGNYNVIGANPYNPLAYVLVITICIIGGLIAFTTAFAEHWSEGFRSRR